MEITPPMVFAFGMGLARFPLPSHLVPAFLSYCQRLPAGGQGWGKSGGAP
ncbi:MAG: hypothetical protein CM15mP103_00890 [Gammaproteobacteria bacterium]|nr:MAG: hypothetical protein CM15mP103_00890 [Gammaproteobacteria bacterium]